ncbi:MAG: lmo0937 family membrane protein [Bacteroidota bacterium]
MLYFIAALLFIAWLGGINTQNSIGGFVHLFLVLSVLVVLLKSARQYGLAQYFPGAHLENSAKHFTVSNAIGLIILVLGLLSMVLGVYEMNTAVPALDLALAMFAAGIIGSSVGFIGLLSEYRKQRIAGTATPATVQRGGKHK